MLISESGTLSGRVAMSCGGVPKTVARKPAESASSAVASGSAGAATGSCAWPNDATSTEAASAIGASRRCISMPNSWPNHFIDIIRPKKGMLVGPRPSHILLR